MSEADDRSGHGVYGGTTRDDAGAQEDPEGSDEAEDAAEWADKTETGGEAAS